MDAEEPERDVRYIDNLSEMRDFGLDDVLDVYRLEECYLATFGNLRREGARRLLQYTRDKLLAPLGLVKTERLSEGPSVEEIADPTVQVTNHNDEGRGLAVELPRIVEWISDVSEGGGADDIEEVSWESTDDEEGEVHPRVHVSTGTNEKEL